MDPKILMVLTSHDRLGNSDFATGFWLEEFTAPYYAFVDSAFEVSIASPKGGQPPVDPTSAKEENLTISTGRFANDGKAQSFLENSLVLKDVSFSDYDAIFYPGGHGPLWDLPVDETSIQLIESFVGDKKPVGAVCHGTAALLEARGEDGKYVVSGKRLTGFTNSEEEAVGLTKLVPFLVEDELIKRGATFTKRGDFEAHVQVDGCIVTGQNPASSDEAALQLMQLVRARMSVS